MPNSPTVNTEGIKKLDLLYVNKLLTTTIWYLIVYNIFAFVEYTFSSNSSNFLSGSFIGVLFLVEDILRQKNIFYKLKSGFTKGFVYFISSLFLCIILSLIWLIPSFFIQNFISNYWYLIGSLYITFPVWLLFAGVKLKWL